MSGTASAFLAKLASQVGYREGQDPNGNWNNICIFGAWYASQVHNPAFNGVAWCDEFISWGAAETGSGDIIPLSAYVPGRLAWFRSRGLTGGIWPPRPGDLGFVMETTYGGNGQTVTQAVHIFAVEKYLGNGQVQTLEGNTNDNGSPQGNGVYRLIRNDSATSTRYVYAHPQWAPEPKPTQPAPTPAPAPAPYVPAPTLGAGERSITVANVRVGNRNEDCRRFMVLLWAAMGSAYRAAHMAAWMSESSELFGPVASSVCHDWYAMRHAADPHNWPPAPSMPTWPGPAMVRAIGGVPQ